MGKNKKRKIVVSKHLLSNYDFRYLVCYIFIVVGFDDNLVWTSWQSGQFEISNSLTIGFYFESPVFLACVDSDFKVDVIFDSVALYFLLCPSLAVTFLALTLSFNGLILMLVFLTTVPTLITIVCLPASRSFNFESPVFLACVDSDFKVDVIFDSVALLVCQDYFELLVLS